MATSWLPVALAVRQARPDLPAVTGAWSSAGATGLELSGLSRGAGPAASHQSVRPNALVKAVLPRGKRENVLMRRVSEENL